MNGTSVRLWLRWSRRDLRRRWPLVTALALIIALGTGAYAGLGGTSAWRISSNDASYAALHMHDLRVRLPDGAFVDGGTLAAAAGGILDAGSIAQTAERLVVPTQVDASTGADTLLVPGDVVGIPAGAPVDSLYVANGQSAAGATAVLEAKFATNHNLPAQGEVSVSGGARVRYAGTGYTPEYFQVTGRTGQMLGESGFAVLFLSLPAAQALTGHPGAVNDLVLRLVSGADRDRVRGQLAAAVSALGATVTTRDDDPGYRALYADARNDQQTWNMFALLILLGAAFAAFNLVTRMIEAQRRELGVGMALGVTPRVLAIRPMLVGAQIAVLGVLGGIGTGWLLALAMRRAMMDLLPLPIWITPFQTGRFAQAAALGLAISLLATLLPLRRALRLQPVDAIRTGAYGASGRRPRRLGRLIGRIRLPGRTYTLMPVRNVVRSVRRSILTALGVAAAITSLVAVLGLLDSFLSVGARNSAEIERTTPDRLTVTLTTLSTLDSPEVRAIAGTSGIGAIVPQLRVPTQLSANGRTLDAVTEVLDLHNTVWAPSIVTGDPDSGIVLSEKAAADLGVRPGDTIELRHPVRGEQGFQLATTRVPVSALHPNPLRPFTYLDTRWADRFGLAGAVNVLTVAPTPGVSQDALLRTLFNQPGVAAVEPASGFGALLENMLDRFTGILRIIEAAILLLALLIAANTASLSADEHAREHATMFAFGLPPRTVVAIAITENAIIGLAGTLAGLGLGYLALRWILSGLDTVMPDLLVAPTLSGTTILITLALGILVVGLAPLLNLRKQRRMDIPATLRVVE